ncbi:MAG TPA: ABC transporter ATP-binding protein [Trebonia sp.]|nr:ABC transporter ATP-binding protein [Trebonia sp.]
MTNTLAAEVAMDVAEAEAAVAPSQASAAIEVRDLTMSYGDRPVLRGVDFEVRAGEVFCLLGPNGAGKTTTVEILEGFRQRTAGTVRVLGMDPAAQPSRLRERIGIVLQECGFPRQARVAELIDIWRAYYPSPLPLADLLTVVELNEDRNSQVRRLSGGQRRRLDLALALAGNPDLIFLDEPTTGFDPESRRRCWAAIENLRALGKTIVLTTHYLDEAERLADRVAILQAGRIQVVGTVRQVARQAACATRITFAAPQRLRDGSLLPPPGLDVAVTGDVATCVTGHTATALRELLAWANSNGLGDLDDLSVENPTLEDAYLQLVCGGAQ